MKEQYLFSEMLDREDLPHKKHLILKAVGEANKDQQRKWKKLSNYQLVAYPTYYTVLITGDHS